MNLVLRRARPMSQLLTKSCTLSVNIKLRSPARRWLSLPPPIEYLAPCPCSWITKRTISEVSAYCSLYKLLTSLLIHHYINIWRRINLPLFFKMSFYWKLGLAPTNLPFGISWRIADYWLKPTQKQQGQRWPCCLFSRFGANDRLYSFKSKVIWMVTPLKLEKLVSLGFGFRSGISNPAKFPLTTSAEWLLVCPDCCHL